MSIDAKDRIFDTTDNQSNGPRVYNYVPELITYSEALLRAIKQSGNKAKQVITGVEAHTVQRVVAVVNYGEKTVIIAN